jgi:hypothetical protein
MVKTTAHALVIAVVAAATPARADTLVFPVEAGDSAAGTRLTRALLAGADTAQPRLADTPLGEAASLLECNPTERACLDSMAQAMEATALLAASTRPAGQKLQVRITYHRRGQAPLTRDVELPADPEAAAPQLEREVRALIKGESAAEPVASAPVAAPVRQEPVATTSAEAERPGGFSLRRVRPWAWAVAGGGLVLVGVGTAFAFKAGGLKDDVEAAPRETVADLEHLRNLEDQGDSATTVSNALLIGGGLALVAGASLIVWQGLRPSAEERAPSISLAPVPVKGGAGLFVQVELP